MSQNSQALPSLQSIKSLPVDFRFTGNVGDSVAMYSSIPEHDSSRDGAGDGDLDIVGIDVNEDSPYSGNANSVGDRPSVGDEDFVTVTLPSPSISTSHTERRWADTASYPTKKVLC